MIAADSQSAVATTPASFRETDFSAGNLEVLRKEMRAAMVKDGLFADEAEALLNTWEASYFKSAGQRLFFLVPRAWTDHYLPLELSTLAELTRLMIGRIELVTPEQRELVRRIAEPPAVHQPLSDFPELRKLAKPSPVPAAYLALGRFRNALIMDERKRRPNESLRTFVEVNGLNKYRP